MKPFSEKIPLIRRLIGRAQPIFAAFLVTTLALPASAGITIPADPLQSSGRIAPNILFILDDSGSMAFDAMPKDSISGWQGRSYLHNTVYYNPSITYQPWVDATGTLLTGGTTYGAVYGDFNFASGNTINLASDSSCRRYNKNNNATSGEMSSGGTEVCGGTQTFYAPISGATNFDLQSSFYRYEIHTDGIIIRSTWGPRVGNSSPYNRGLNNRGCSTDTGSNFRNCTEVAAGDPNVTRSAAGERANYATWFSYHRTRMKAAKAGAGNAFVDIGKDVRVGFRTIWGRTKSGNPLTEDKPILVDRNDGLFDDPHGAGGANNNRSLWYDRLYGAVGYNGTPLHAALRRAGEYYSSDSQAGPYGPQKADSQFACRQNFSILTTDGYWNNLDNVDMPGEQDNTNGLVIEGPAGQSYQYTPTAPYASAYGNTLADMAMKYWKNDLRTDMDNLVPTSSVNPAFWQHMVTFGISIGEKGTLNPATDLPKLEAGLAWPQPGSDKIENIDDLWHASINGRGKFLVAQNPDEFATGLRSSLAAIIERTGSFSNVAASSTRLDTGTQLFQASYVSGVWAGDLKAYGVSAGGIATNATWNASAGIPATGRKIFTIRGTSGAPFPTAAQVTSLGGADTASYIAGNRSKELNSGGTFRNRNHLLGDIVSSSPAYDKVTNTVFVGANDGMLHAFSGDLGAELFAYVPGGIDLSALKTLTDPGYGHRYFVDGPLAISRREQTVGKSLLVGALGRGGKGIFSLDVTTPSSFAASNVKWEVKETAGNNMGLVLGMPIIAKLNNGEMGVIVPNGINSAGDRAALLIFRLSDGALLAEIDTGEGSAADPNGMFGPTTRDLDGNGTVDLVFAGDLHGNLWEFDISSASPSAWSTAANRMVLFSAKNGLGQRQPITAAPSVARDPATYDLWVFFGTGRFLNEDDVADTDVQSLYGLKIGTTAITSRATQLQERKIVISGYKSGLPVRGFEAASPLTSTRGWYIDLLSPPAPGSAEGERVVSDAQVIANVLLTSSIVSNADPCLPGGKGYVNAIDAFTGASLKSSFFDLNRDGNFGDETVGTSGPPIGSVDLGIGMPTLASIIGKLIGVGGSGGTTKDLAIDLPTTSGRVSWREVIRE